MRGSPKRPWQHIDAKGIISFEEIIQKHSTVVVGNGRRIKFWSDMWCDSVLLCTKYPNLFALSILPEGTVADHRCGPQGSGSWNILFRRTLFDREISDLGPLLQAIEGVQVTEEEDSRVWRKGTISFSLKTAYRQIESEDGKGTYRCVRLPCLQDMDINGALQSLLLHMGRLPRPHSEHR